MKQISLWSFVKENIHVNVINSVYKEDEKIDVNKLKEVEGYGRKGFYEKPNDMSWWFSEFKYPYKRY